MEGSGGGDSGEGEEEEEEKRSEEPHRGATTPTRTRTRTQTQLRRIRSGALRPMTYSPTFLAFILYGEEKEDGMDSICLNKNK